MLRFLSRQQQHTSSISSSSTATSTTSFFFFCSFQQNSSSFRQQSSSQQNSGGGGGGGKRRPTATMEPPRMPGAAPNIRIGGFADQESSPIGRVLSGGRPTIRPVSDRHSVPDRAQQQDTQQQGPILSSEQQQTNLLKKGGAKRLPSKADAKGFRLLGMMREGIDMAQNNEQRHSVSLSGQRPPGSVAIGKQSSAAMPFTGRNKPKASGDGSVLGKARIQPLNPLYQDLPEDQMARSPPGKDRDLVYNKSTRKKLQSIKFTAAQTDAIIDSFAATKWYGFVWKRLKWVDPNKIKSYKRWAIGGFLCCLFVVFGIVWYVYRNEMDLFVQMEPEDQRDFKKVIFGARMGEVIPIGEAALDKEDPLRILPVKEKMRIIVEAWRAAGLVDKDWELVARKRKSLFAEPDIQHMFYWFCLTCGRYLIGGGYLWWGIEDEQLRQAERDQDNMMTTYDGTTGGMVNTRDLGKQREATGL